MSLRDKAIAVAKQYLPQPTRNWAVRQQRRFGLQWPRRGRVNFGSFGRVTPISPIFGIERGLPIDRYYIERFLDAHRADVRGCCLELGDSAYIRQFGDSHVTHIDVLHLVPGNPAATIVADLTRADDIPSDRFDCIIFTQSLQMIYDMKSALRHLHRVLAPAGALLLTAHGISKIGRRLGRDPWGEYWRITAQSAEQLFADTFPGAQVEVVTYGNVLTAMCSLHGLASEEISQPDLDFHDPDFEVIVAVRALKGAASG